MKILIVICLLTAAKGFYCVLPILNSNSYYNQFTFYLDPVGKYFYMTPVSFYGTGYYQVSLSNWDLTKAGFFISASDNATLSTIISQEYYLYAYYYGFKYWNNATDYVAFFGGYIADQFTQAFSSSYSSLCLGYGYLDGSPLMKFCPGLSIWPTTAKCIPYQNGYQICDPSCYECMGPGPNLCVGCANSNLMIQPAATGTYFGACVAACKPGTYYYSGNNSCLICGPNCATCNNNTAISCLSCAPGFYWNSGSHYCYDSCPAGYYGDLQGNCSSCDPKCTTCSGPEAMQCNSCNSGYYLVSPSSCNDSCPTGYYQDDSTNKCVICDPSCSSCIGPTSSNCTSCALGYYLDVSGLGCGTTCPQGYWLDQVLNNCTQCSKECSICSGPSNQLCSACSQGFYLFPNSSTCSSTCPSGYFMGDSSTCLSCPIMCLNCDGTICFSCLAGYFLQPSLTENSCSVSCPSGYWKNTTFSVCSPCNSNCLECFGPTNHECSACRGSNYLNPTINSCGADCPDGYYKDSSNNTCDACNASCAACMSSSSCSTCNTGYYKQPNSQLCLDSCPMYGYWPSSTNNSCSPCAAECSACSGPTSDDCYQCKTKYYMQPFNNTCSSTCPSGYSLDSTNNVCTVGTTRLTIGSVVGLAVGGSILLASVTVLFVCYLKKVKVYRKLVESTAKIKETA